MAKDGFRYALSDAQMELWSLAEAVLSARSFEAAQAAAREALDARKLEALSITCAACGREVRYEERDVHRSGCSG
jgi:hypothetical protein